MKIIGLSGKIGTGKSTAAAGLVETCFMETMFSAAEISIASSLKACAAALTGDDRFHESSQEFKNEPCALDAKYTNGQFLVRLGDALRSIDPDIFVKSVEAKINASDKDIVVIPDVRFPSEQEMIKRRGGIVIRLEGDPAGVRAASTRDPNHPTETALDGAEFDAVFQNTGDKKDLHKYMSGVIGAFM